MLFITVHQFLWQTECTRSKKFLPHIIALILPMKLLHKYTPLWNNMTQAKNQMNFSQEAIFIMGLIEFSKAEFIDINLLRDLRYVLKHSICTLHCSICCLCNEIYIISSIERSEKHIDFDIVKNIEQTKVCI